MRYPYIIVDNSDDNLHETLHKLERFTSFYCVGKAFSNEEALDLILDAQPVLVFLTITGSGAKSAVSLSLIGQLHQYLNQLPHFAVLSATTEYSYDAIKAGVFDYLLQPLATADIVKCMLRVQKTLPVPTALPVTEPPTVNKRVKEEPEEKEILPPHNMQMCIKSYGDYQFISLNDVVYLKADNNTTDFYLQSGRKLTAYKTLKYYENNLPNNFYRIHNSYIVNAAFVTRISTGKSLCYLNGNEIAVSFSKTYKENLDILIKNISTDYL